MPLEEIVRLRHRIRWALIIFVVGLVLSGVTAFPLLTEVDLLCAILGLPGDAIAEGHTGLSYWLLRVREGLAFAQLHYPFLAYGTDWLAFGHLVIALFFVAPIREPGRHLSVLYAGIAACVLVVPLAMICGPIRSIPFYWRLIDSSFGLIGAIPLLIALRLSKRLNQLETTS